MTDEEFKQRQLWKSQREMLIANLNTAIEMLADPSCEMLGMKTKLTPNGRPYALCNEYFHSLLIPPKDAIPLMAGLFNADKMMCFAVWQISEQEEIAARAEAQKRIAAAGSDFCTEVPDDSIPVMIPPTPSEDLS